MAGKRPVFAENFSANLTAIEVFLGPDGRRRFTRLLDRLFDDIIPTLCRFPRSGCSFLERTVQSTKAETLVKDLRRMLRPGDDLREYVMDDYLILYLVRRNEVIFLSIKHHRQLSFDLAQFWLEE
ncbi:Type II toxin-antitoxin system RelE/ParE family toxin [Nitrospira tepida]|uniref:Type II toxin-antitoxin system RelE/ParE family toxin n=1 Tax=Nitrospira tepida TaxID=2973512 RepID=A0AA86T9M5_9BACT|nr:type II toxin-antitoxin system RelE/ParE family toxin [Nitrospira tepida]CAI4032853.1 Type II toxin-antitoxin system RelE/ParE family toxin [Nitrospira tepida]